MKTIIVPMSMLIFHFFCLHVHFSVRQNFEDVRVRVRARPCNLTL